MCASQPQRESSFDPLAAMRQKVEKEKEKSAAEGEGAGDDEWDD